MYFCHPTFLLFNKLLISYPVTAYHNFHQFQIPLHPDLKKFDPKLSIQLPLARQPAARLSIPVFTVGGTDFTSTVIFYIDFQQLFPTSPLPSENG